VFSYDSDDENDLLEIYWYDPTTSLWQILTNISSNGDLCFGLALIIRDNFVLTMGDSCVLMLDLSLKSSSLVSLTDMSVERDYFGFCVLDDLLYVVSLTCNQLILCCSEL